ncbi:MAG: type II secretion system minor pseudopilin GspI [Pseudomonadota bacterium]
MTRSAKPEAGFSLMEVIVALGILATAAVGFTSLLQGSVEGTREVQERYLARVVADNQLTDIVWRRLPLEQGVTSGTESQMGREFLWTLTILPGPRPELVFVDVQVRRGEDPEGAVIAQATTLRAIQ